MLWTNARLTKRGAEPWVVIDISLLAVPLAIIGARIYHVLTHWGFYFGEGTDPCRRCYIWEGGIAIYGALIGGAIGAWLGCRWTGIRFWTFADALAPASSSPRRSAASATGSTRSSTACRPTCRGASRSTTTTRRGPIGLPEGTLFHPTFLYEVIWNASASLVLLWVGRRSASSGVASSASTSSGTAPDASCGSRSASIRATSILGLRTNVWAAIIGVILGLVIFFVQKRRHPGSSRRPTCPAASGTAGQAVQSQDTDDFVDVSEPPTSEADEVSATSTPCH